MTKIEDNVCIGADAKEVGDRVETCENQPKAGN